MGHGLLGAMVLGLAACGEDSRECENWGEPVSTGTLASAEISEASGLVASRIHEDLFWTHNDAGDGARLFALDSSGAHEGTVDFSDEDAKDWEDIAAGVGADGKPWLYIGDIGDNDLNRDEIRVWRTAEPADPKDDDIELDKLDLSYPDGPHDAETLLFDPRDNTLYVVTKSDGDQAEVYATDAHAEDDQELEHVASINLVARELADDAALTGGDISAAGDWILLRTQGQIFAWARAASSTLAETLELEPCLAPTPIQDNGESLAMDGDSYFTVGEGTGAPVWQASPP